MELLKILVCVILASNTHDIRVDIFFLSFSKYCFFFFPFFSSFSYSFSFFLFAAFDMCGIVCGHLLLPLWMFLGATMVGKGFMKAPMQAFFFVAMFRKSTADYVLATSFVNGVESLINKILLWLKPEAEMISFLEKINSQREKMGTLLNDCFS